MIKTTLMTILVLLQQIASAQSAPPSAIITSVEFRGTGCDAESARVSITSDMQYMSILYDRFSAQVGAGAINPNARKENKNCSVVVKFDLSAGWTFQFEAVELRGFARLEGANSTAQQQISVDVPTGKIKNFDAVNLRGPYTDNYTTIIRTGVEADGNQGRGRGNGNANGPKNKTRKGDLFDCSDRVRNASLRISSRISASNQGDPKASAAQIIVDSTDASFVQKLKINWNKCL